MKKDIKHPVVKNIAVAVVKVKKQWNVYLLNLKKADITTVIVASKGYGRNHGEKVKTSVLRHLWDSIPAGSFVKIEPIMENLLGLNNEYWVSFYIKNTIYDKKYVFLAESIKEENFITVPLLNKKGVMLK